MKQSKKHLCNKQTKEESVKKALSRVVDKIGEEESKKVKTEFCKSEKSEQDGIIRSLLAQGLSQIEVRSLLGIGGHRTQRIAKLVGAGEEEKTETRPPPKHACVEEDKEAVRLSVHYFDIEPGYPCAHRKPVQYYHDPTVEWKDVFNKYVEERISAHRRILSFNRWREYVRYFHPRLYLRRALTDMCNACYRIETSLSSNELSDERRADLLQQKETHLGKVLSITE